jgi:hypothetical protein
MAPGVAHQHDDVVPCARVDTAPVRAPARPRPATVGRSCTYRSAILQGGREDELPAHCFTCAQPIPEDEVTPVFALITLRQPLTVHHGPDREFRYMGELETLPITYLCSRHRDQVDLPIQLKWPRR